MKEILKKNQAITLVSLVVTIIILIILAGVSINLILGKNGIITIAKQAKENTELAKIEEETRLNELYMQIEAEGISTGDTSYDAITKLVEFKREIASAITDMGIETSEEASVDTMASNIRSIVGASSADKVTYDNTNSGLTATNVQSAVDEVNENLIKYPNYSATPTNLNIGTSKTTITIEEDGWIKIIAKSGGTYDTAGWVYGYINSETDIAFSCQGSRSVADIKFLPVKCGDIVTAIVSDVNSNKVYFYPNR